MRPRHTCLSCLIQQSRQLLSPCPSATTRSVSSLAGTSPTWTRRERLCYRRPRGARTCANKAYLTYTSSRVAPHARCENGSTTQVATTSPQQSRRVYSTAALDAASVKMAPDATRHIQALSKVKSKMNLFLNSSKDAGKLRTNEMSIEQALGAVGGTPSTFEESLQRDVERVTTILGEEFPGEEYATLRQRIEEVLAWKAAPAYTRAIMLLKDPPLASLLAALGLTQPPEPSTSMSDELAPTSQNSNVSEVEEKQEVPLATEVGSTGDEAKASSGSFKSIGAMDHTTEAGSIGEEIEVSAGSFKSFKAVEIAMEAVPTDDIEVPRLSFDLSRVLFNPGVYQLQDPRSRVYNFDPYLEKIMPVTEFNFEALNHYVTSSEDNTLRDLAMQRQRRYIGSSSSMTSTLAHFHFLLSAWRSLNVSILSRGFKAESDNFTKFQRAPTAVFLRYKDGVYAMDADKEFDDATVLLSLGRSMEKLLTLEKDNYEKLRKSNAIESGQFDLAPEKYHYSELGSFLMRSQLDAHDPRLPGTGMFDLKTRAVVAVRMTMADQRGTGYEIKHRYGTWESFEREYYDMMRSAFLKYSLQVRMGRMDGVFVAYHNIERIFGFQYISLAEMDRALHGQTNRTLGDQEFRLSVKLLTEVFDRSTREFPNQSLRFHFETRESTATKSEAKPWMYVFAEPVAEEEIDRIQTSRHEEVKEAEERILSGKARSRRQPSRFESQQKSNAGDIDFLNSLAELKIETEPLAKATSSAGPGVMGMKVVVQNRIDGLKTVRPVDLTKDEIWELDYNITDMPNAQAEARYAQCKARRSITFNASRDGEAAAEGYISRLIDMSEAGARWRKDRDEMDAARQRVVLYDGRANSTG